MASYEQSAKKTWSVRFRIIENGVEANKRLSGFATKKASQQAYMDFMSTYVAPIKEKGEPFDITFDELFKAFIKHSTDRVKSSTIYDLTNTYRKHIKDHFADKKLIKIKKTDIVIWQSYLNDLGYSYKYKTKLRGFLSNILNYAVKYYDLPTNEVLRVDNFRNTGIKKEMEIWSPTEFKQFLAVIPDDDIIYKSFFLLLYLTGCRKGEALALTWNDINFNTGAMTINKSLTRKCIGATYEITTPKNNSSVRNILIPTDVTGQLSLLKSSIPEYKPTNLIFSNNGIPLAENTISRTFKSYCAAADVKIIRLHDMRHSHASLLINSGESIVLVAKRLGHANIEQTLNTYSHMMPNQELEMVSKLNIL